MNEVAYWLALHHAPGIGTVTYFQLLEHYKTPQALFSDGLNDPLLARIVPKKALEYLNNPPWKLIDKDLEWLKGENNHIVTFYDANYPKLLKEISDPPPLLFIHGTPSLLNQPQIAIVGSRNPTRTGLDLAYEFAKSLSTTGLTVTSGLAIGIDGAGHRGALAADGKTIAVTGTGLDRIYPARHHELAHQIAEKGALVSEFAPGTPALASNFPRRNRIISGLSLGTLVVEATLKSGSLITAKLAAEQGREVFAIPGSIHNPLTRGCHTLIRQGAKLVETATDILEELTYLYKTQTTQFSETRANLETDNEALDHDMAKVLDCLGFDPTPIDLLVEQTGLTADVVSSMLLVLELHGKVSSSGGFYFRISNQGFSQ